MASLCAFHDIHTNSLNLILISFLTVTSYKLTYGSFASILVHSSYNIFFSFKRECLRYVSSSVYLSWETDMATYG